MTGRQGGKGQAVAAGADNGGGVGSRGCDNTSVGNRNARRRFNGVQSPR